MCVNQKGQSLIELVVVIAVIGLVIGAFAFATISSIRNASLSQNQSQATKLAQEGQEKVRSIRDRNSAITTDIVFPGTNPPRNIEIFSELYSVFLSRNHCNDTNGDAPCHFRLEPDPLDPARDKLVKVVDSVFETENISPFRRQITIGDIFSDAQGLYLYEKTITVVVQWTDFSCGSTPFCHESKHTTILRKL